jgi:hypothetical protein
MLKVFVAELNVHAMCVHLLAGIKVVVLLASLSAPLVITFTLPEVILRAYLREVPRKEPFETTPFVAGVVAVFTHASTEKLPVMLSEDEFGTAM